MNELSRKVEKCICNASKHNGINQSIIESFMAFTCFVFFGPSFTMQCIEEIEGEKEEE
jgi:hypothetical protein